MSQRICVYHEENVCTICGRAFTHKKRFYLEDAMNFQRDRIKCLELITTHTSCKVLVDKIKRLKDELFALEFTLCCKKI